MRRRPPRRVLALCAALAAACLGSPPDSGGDPDAGRPDARAGEPCPGNLVADGSFEQGTAGWGSVQSTATRIDDAFDGVYAIEVCYDGTSDEDEYYSLDDNPNTVPNPMTGETYRVRAWVRAGPEIGAQEVAVSIREFDEAGAPHPRSATVSPDEVWQEATSMLTVESAAPESVDVYFASTSPELGNCFQLDAVCVQRVE